MKQNHLFDMGSQKPKHDSRVSKFMRTWQNLYAKRFGYSYIDGAPAKHFAIIKRLLLKLDSRYGKDRSLPALEMAAGRLIAGKLRWLRGKGTPNIGQLSIWINELLNINEGKGNPTANDKPDWNKIEQLTASAD